MEARKNALYAVLTVVLFGCGESDDGMNPGTGGAMGSPGGSPATTGGSAGGSAVAGAGGSSVAGHSAATGGTGPGSGGSTPGGGAGGSAVAGATSGGASGSSAGGSSAGSTGVAGTAGTATTDHSAFTEVLGWATEEGGITGGGNAAPQLVESLDALNSAAGGSDPRVIYVSGKFSGSLRIGSNKTIIGLPGTEIKSGGNTLSMPGSKNVILRNIAFIGAPDGTADMANISGGSHIWLDHLELVDGGDGMLDIVNGSNYITISWCKLRYTGKTGHQNAMLLSSSNGAGDHGKNKITMHHNWWAENVAERMPRVRFGQVHIFNNLYVATPDFTYYAVRCGYDANVRSEKNIYKDFTGTTPLYNGGAVLAFNYFDGSASSVLESIDDLFINCTERAVDSDGVEGGTFSNGTAFTPPYAYATGSTDTLEAAVMAGAGPTMQTMMP